MEAIKKDNVFDHDVERNFETAGASEGRESWKFMIQNLYTDMSSLMDKERALVRAELSEKFTDLKQAMVSMAVASVFLVMGMLALVATAIALLWKSMELWHAAGIVTLAFMVIGVVLLMVGKKKMTAEHMRPNHSIDTLGEIKTTFKEKINEYKSGTRH